MLLLCYHSHAEGKSVRIEWEGSGFGKVERTHAGARAPCVDPAALAAALTERTVLVSVTAANNETGALQPVAKLARITPAQGALFHCDAAQVPRRKPPGGESESPHEQCSDAACDCELPVAKAARRPAPVGRA
jgi:hypothetical protein